MSMFGATVEKKRLQLRRAWWLEFSLVVVFYFGYEWIAGETSGTKSAAFRNTLREIRLENAVGLFHEQGLQHFFIGLRWLVQGCNDYYTTVHFAVPVVALVWLYRRHPDRYRLWRNIFAWMTLISLVIFALFPVAPPRLLPASYGFVDTVATMGGAGPLDTFLMSSVGDPYAAMPSLHFAWAAWSALALAPVLPRRYLRLALWLDPAITTFVVIVTGNHFFIDIAGGALVLAIAMGLGALLTRTGSAPEWAPAELF